MPNDKYKSAAVPFVNQKGERSMKRVKVGRYVAGKRPAYANDDDDDEYYVTDEEQDDEDNEEYSGDEDGEQSDDDDNNLRAVASRNLDHLNRDSDEDSCSDNKTPDIRDSDDEYDDPRLRRLRQIQSMTIASELLDLQLDELIRPKYESHRSNIIIDDDDDEESIKQRHKLAVERQLDEPIGLQAVMGLDRQLDLMPDDDDEDGAKQAKRPDLDDILKDFKLTGISRPVREKLKTAEEEEAEQRKLKEMLEQAKQVATFTSQVHRKVEEDIKREIEREALAKGDIGSREMTSVNTDDEDEELAYEEWKLREIKRVQRYRSERMLATKAR